MFTALEIQYQTLTLPPPYAYTYTLRATPTASGLDVQLAWQYTDREELSTEEIEEEGFAADGDFNWKGTLPTVWTEVLVSLLADTNLLSEKEDDEDLVEKSALLFITKDSANEPGIPNNSDAWEYCLQELIQGTYEISEQEQPWHFRYVAIDNNQTTEVVLEAQFAHRRLVATVSKESHSRDVTLPWAELQVLISMVYTPDYHDDNSQFEKPKREGTHVSFGEGWYTFGRSVTNPGKDNVMKKITEAIDKIITQI